jgi:hypothetical protein
MSSREKKLLTLFAIAGFVVVNLLGLSFYKKKSVEVGARLLAAEQTLQRNEMFEASREQSMDEMKWLQKNLPDPAEYENVQTALQSFCVAEARRFGLTLVELPMRNRETVEGNHFQRVQVSYKLSGTEENLYRWLDRVNMPAQLRAGTRVLLTPNKEDDTQIDCTTTIEQWFVPASPTV